MKILVSDYDQTLYLNDIDMNVNKEYIDKFRLNNKFIIATGRSYQDFMNAVNETNIKYDYALVDHGSIIMNENNEIIKSFFIPDNIVKNIKNDLELFSAERFFCCSLKESRVSFDHSNVTKINVKYNDPKTRDKVYNIVYQKYNKVLNIYRVSNRTLEMISKETSKFLGTKYLTDKLNIDKKDVYAIGDGYTDIDMVKEFNGACMEDSVDELLKVSPKKYSSVSKFIEEILK